MNVDQLVFGIPSEAQQRQLGEILGQAFSVKLEQEIVWFKALGHKNLRIIRSDDEVLGGLGLIPMGMFVGGRSVPMCGVAAVGVRQDILRKGVASKMMRAMLEEAADDGFAISTLYASTFSLYRRVGYESAGSAFKAKLLAREIPFRETTLSARIATPDDLPTVHDLYRRVACTRSGFIDRGPYIWPRLTAERFGVPAYGVLFEDAGEVEGYVYYRKHSIPGHRSDVEVTDVCATTKRGWARAWTAMRDLGSMVEHITVPTAPNDPMHLLFPDPRFTTSLYENWLIRICDLPKALQARGWPAGAKLSLELDIDDDVLERNAGRWQVEIEGGEASVRRGGSGGVRLHIRALAALYTGFASADTLAAVGLLEASDAERRAVSAAFAGPAPWMREMF